MRAANTPLGHHTDHCPMGLGQYDSLGEYCGPHTASSVFLILLNDGGLPAAEQVLGVNAMLRCSVLVQLVHQRLHGQRTPPQEPAVTVTRHGCTGQRLPAHR